MNMIRIMRPLGLLLLGVVWPWIIWLSMPPMAFALGGTQIPLGSPAPDFTLPTNSGDGEISLANFKDQWVVLYFYPRDFTSGCTLEAQRFQKDIQAYRDRHAQVIGVSADSVDSHAEFCEAEGLEFPLLSDPKGAVSKAYGSWFGVMSLRHTYIIAPDGTLAARFLGVQPAIHSQEVLAALDELQRKV